MSDLIKTKQFITLDENLINSFIIEGLKNRGITVLGNAKLKLDARQIVEEYESPRPSYEGVVVEQELEVYSIDEDASIKDAIETLVNNGFAVRYLKGSSDIEVVEQINEFQFRIENRFDADADNTQMTLDEWLEKILEE